MGPVVTAARPVGPDPSQLDLGLDVLPPGPGPMPALERTARAQIAALNDAGRLNDGHAILVGLVLDLARTVGIGAQAGKAAGVAMAARQLLDALDKLPPLVPEADAGADRFAQLVAALGGPAADPA